MSVAALGLAPLLSCSSGRRYTVNEAWYLHSGDMLVPKGSGCSYIELPGSSGAPDGPHPGDFAVVEGPDGDAFEVRVFSDEALLAERRLDEAQLASGNVYELAVTTHSGAVFTLKYWGGACSLEVDGGAD
jgi:hypothetical protein